jgi:hypothetical protein
MTLESAPQKYKFKDEVLAYVTNKIAANPLISDPTKEAWAGAISAASQTVLLRDAQRKGEFAALVGAALDYLAENRQTDVLKELSNSARSDFHYVPLGVWVEAMDHSERNPETDGAAE